MASVSLVACADSPGDQTPASGDFTYTRGDRSVLVHDGAGSSTADPPKASLLSPGDVDGQCWVTLDWCSQPGTGDAVCTFTNCTISRAIDACDSLIDSHC
ncbi:MAG TPA: hypothetical protein VGD37_24500 [Kofleriaceae bacterium]